MSDKFTLKQRSISEDLAVATMHFETAQDGALKEFSDAVIQALKAGLSIDDIGRANLVRLLEQISKASRKSQLEKIEIRRLLRFLQEMDMLEDSPLSSSTEKRGSLRRAISSYQQTLSKLNDDELNNTQRAIRDGDLDECCNNVRNWNRNGGIS